MDKVMVALESTNEWSEYIYSLINSALINVLIRNLLYLQTYLNNQSKMFWNDNKGLYDRFAEKY